MMNQMDTTQKQAHEILLAAKSYNNELFHENPNLNILAKNFKTLIDNGIHRQALSHCFLYAIDAIPENIPVLLEFFNDNFSQFLEDEPASSLPKIKRLSCVRMITAGYKIPLKFMTFNKYGRCLMLPDVYKAYLTSGVNLKDELKKITSSILELGYIENTGEERRDGNIVNHHVDEIILMDDVNTLRGIKREILLGCKFFPFEHCPRNGPEYFHENYLEINALDFAVLVSSEECFTYLLSLNLFNVSEYTVKCALFGSATYNIVNKIKELSSKLELSPLKGGEIEYVTCLGTPLAKNGVRRRCVTDILEEFQIKIGEYFVTRSMDLAIMSFRFNDSILMFKSAMITSADFFYRTVKHLISDTLDESFPFTSVDVKFYVAFEYLSNSLGPLCDYITQRNTKGISFLHNESIYYKEGFDSKKLEFICQKFNVNTYVINNDGKLPSDIVHEIINNELDSSTQVEQKFVEMYEVLKKYENKDASLYGGGNKIMSIVKFIIYSVAIICVIIIVVAVVSKSSVSSTINSFKEKIKSF